MIIQLANGERRTDVTSIEQTIEIFDYLVMYEDGRGETIRGADITRIEVGP